MVYAGLMFFKREVSPTPTPGHSEVDGERLFLSLCSRSYLPTRNNLGAASSARSSPRIHAGQIKTETQDRHGGAASARSLRLTSDKQDSVLTV